MGANDELHNYDNYIFSSYLNLSNRLILSHLNTVCSHLRERGLSTVGTKNEKLSRLEQFLIGQGYNPSPRAVKRTGYNEDKENRTPLGEELWLQQLDYNSTNTSSFLSTSNNNTPLPLSNKKPIKTYSKRTSKQNLK